MSYKFSIKVDSTTKTFMLARNTNRDRITKYAIGESLCLYDITNVNFTPARLTECIVDSRKVATLLSREDEIVSPYTTTVKVVADKNFNMVFSITIDSVGTSYYMVNKNGSRDVAASMYKLYKDSSIIPETTVHIY